MFETAVELDSRKGTVLKALVVEYVISAEPVGSEALAQKYDLGVRAATVRNVLADLLDQGYVAQPHTSAGRLPSDAGYRYYVDTFVRTKPLAGSVRSLLDPVSHQDDVLQCLLRDTVSRVSRATQLMAAATVARNPEVSIRAALLTALDASQGLLVLALSNGAVENRTVDLPTGITLQDFGRVNEVLGRTVAGRSLREVVRDQGWLSDGSTLSELLGIVSGLVSRVAQDQMRSPVIVEGEEFLIAQPEFRHDASALADLLTRFRDSDVLYHALTQPDGSGTRTVTIGRENRDSSLQTLSVIRQTFRTHGKEVGTLAIVGPTRMRYEGGIAVIDYAARALSRALDRTPA